jgi:gliding motility-associated-like protein
MDNYCGASGGPNSPYDISASIGCFIEVNNTEWISFVAGSTSLSLKIEVEDCTSIGVGSGLQASVVQPNDCSLQSGWELFSNCWIGTGVEEDITLNATGLVIGEQYYIMIDGYDGALCDYKFEVLSGTVGSSINNTPNNPTGPMEVCPGSTGLYNVALPTSATSCTWSATSSIIVPGFTYESLVSGFQVAFPDAGQPYTVEICVEGNNACSTGPALCFTIMVTTAIAGVNPPDMILCAGESGTFNGVTYNYGVGTPILQTVPVTFTTANGCDSSVVLAVRRVPSATSTKTAYLCPGEAFIFCGTSYTTVGLQVATCPNGSYLGCDSTMFLTIFYNNLNAVATASGQINCTTPCVTLSGTTSTASGAKTYKWFDPSGSQIGTASTLSVCQPGTYTMVLNSTVIIPPPTGGTKVCTDTTTIVVLSDPSNSLPTIPTITGAASVCPNQSAAYTIAGVAGATANWTITGGSITSGQGTNSVAVTWGVSGGSIAVSLTNVCGTSPLATQAVGLITLATTAPPDETICPNESVTLTATALTASQWGAWSFVALAGATGTESITMANSSSVTFSIDGAGQYYAIFTLSEGGCTDIDTTLVTVGSSLTTSNLALSCNNIGSQITISYQINGGTAPYTVLTSAGGSSAGTVTAGGLFTSNTMTPTGSYPFYISDALGCDLTINPTGDCGCLSYAGQMNQDTLTSCTGLAIQVNVIAGTPFLDADDIDEYVMHTGSGTTLGTIKARNQSGLMPFIPGIMTYGTVYYVSNLVGDVINVNQVNTGNNECFDLAAGQPIIFYQPLTAPNAGLNLDICGLTIDMNASTPPVNVLGTWTSQTGLTFADPNSPESAVTAINTGTYEAYWTYSIAGSPCTRVDTVALVFHTASVVSNIDFTCDAINQNYQVSFNVSGSGPFDITDNINSATISSTGNFTSVSLPTQSAYSFLVTDTFGCETPVSGNYACGCETMPGNMNPAPLSTCDDEVVLNYLGGEALDGNDVLMFSVFDETGDATTDYLFLTPSTTISFDPALMTYGLTYNVVAIAGDQAGAGIDFTAGCFGITNVVQVTFYQPTPTPNAGLNLDVCGLSIALSGSVPQVGISGSWSGQPGLTFDNTALFDAQVTAGSAGTYQAYWTYSTTTCTPVTDTIVLIFHESALVNNTNFTCDAIYANYQVSFDITGNSPYEVTDFNDGSTIMTSSSFTSVNQPTNSGYSFLITDAFGCETPVSGTYSCGCGTSVGLLDQTPINSCSDQISLNYGGGEVLDANDVLLFAVYPVGGDPFTGSILLTASTTISFNAATMSYNTPYEVVAVAGDQSGAGIDFVGSCVAFSNPVTIAFNQVPTATWGTYPNSICVGQCADIPVQFTGDGPYQIDLSNGLTWNSQSADTTFTYCAEATGQLCMTQVSGSLCSQPVNICIDYVAIPAGTAGNAQAINDICVGTTANLNLFDHLLGEDTGGTWTDISTAAMPAGSLNTATGVINPTNLTVGDYQISYTVSNSGVCPNSVSTLNLTVVGPSAVEAGAAALLNCINTSATLGTAAATGTNYEWLLGAASVGNTATIAVSAIGTYTLVATNSAGCTQSDNVTVTSDFAAPVATLSASINPLTCTTTQSTLNSTTTGAMSYAWYLGGVSTPGATSQLVVSTPGVYSLVVTSLVNGCADTATLTLNSQIALPAVALAMPAPITCTQLTSFIDAIGTATGANIVLSWAGNAILDQTNPYLIEVGNIGTYTVTVTNTTTGCTATTTAQVLSDQALPQITASGTMITCQSTTGTLSATINTNGDPYQSVWFTTDGALTGTLNDLTATAVTAGTYFIAVANLENGCADTTSVAITVNGDLPTEILLTATDALCFGDCNGQVSVDSVIGGSAPYLISFNGQNPSLNDLFNNLCPNTYDIEITDANGCMLASTATVNQPDQIEVYLGNDTTIYLGNTLLLTATTNISALQVESLFWPELLITCTTSAGCDQQTVTPLDNMSYSVILTDMAGCTAEASMLVDVKKERQFFAPNAFSPDDDGKNDYFQIFPGIEVARIHFMRVYDRWGNCVFSEENPDLANPLRGWNGFYRGELQTTGVYTYAVEIEYIDGLKRVYGGDVTLVY